MGLSAHVLHTRPAKSDGMDMLCTQLLTAPSQKATGSKALETYECCLISTDFNREDQEWKN
jgi:hypothetical protein